MVRAVGLSNHSNDCQIATPIPLFGGIVPAAENILTPKE